jgi:hypothetical protein
MGLALVNLDSGLFLCGSTGWTVDLRVAIKFHDIRAVCAAAKANQIKNAAAAFLNNEGTARGFFWLSEPNSN